MIRTINNAIRTLLAQAKLSPSYWVEALHVAVHLINILPSAAIQNQIPHTVLFQQNPTYHHLLVFGCLCFPNLNYSHLNKLAPRSTPCLFIGYPSQHRGYRCLDLKTKKIIISRHVYFDEEKLPAANSKQQISKYQFLDHNEESSPLFQSILQSPMPNTEPPQTQNPSPQPQAPAPPRHPMTTRAMDGIHKPKSVLSLLTTSKPPLPKSYIQALADPNWNPSICDEHDAMIKTGSWDLVPCPKNVNIVRSMWLHRHKYDANGNLKRH